jgi:hypothetical protein
MLHEPSYVKLATPESKYLLGFNAELHITGYCT